MSNIYKDLQKKKNYEINTNRLEEQFEDRISAIDVDDLQFQDNIPQKYEDKKADNTLFETVSYEDMSDQLKKFHIDGNEVTEVVAEPGSVLATMQQLSAQARELRHANGDTAKNGWNSVADIIEKLTGGKVTELSKEDYFKNGKEVGRLEEFNHARTQLENYIKNHPSPHMERGIKRLELAKQTLDYLEKLSLGIDMERGRALVESADNADADIFVEAHDDPIQIGEWLKASAEKYGASNSFRQVIKAYDYLLSGTHKEIEGNRFYLEQSINRYLEGHKSAIRTFGKQRIAVLKSIKEYLPVLPQMVAWKKTINANPETQDELSAVSTSISKGHSIATKNYKIPQSGKFDRAMINVLKPIDESLDKETLEANQKWNDVFISNSLELNNIEERKKAANLSEEAKKELSEEEAKIRKERKPYLDSMVKELLSIKKEDINRMIYDPSYYKENYARILRLSGIATWVTDSRKFDVDNPYFDEMDPAMVDELESKGMLMFSLKNSVNTMIKSLSITDSEYEENNQTVFSGGGHKFRDIDIIKNDWTTEKVGLADIIEDAFKPYYMRTTSYKNAYKDMNKENTERNIYDLYTRLLKEGRNIKGLENEFDRYYQRVKEAIKSFGPGGDRYHELEIPSIEKAKEIAASGSMEQLFALWQMLEHYNEIDTKNGLNDEYEQVRLDINARLGIKAKNKRKMKASKVKPLSKEESMRFALVGTAVAYMARKEFFKYYHKHDSDYKDTAIEAKKNRRKKAYIKYKSTPMGKMWESPIAPFVGSNNEYLLFQPGMLENVITDFPGYEEYRKESDRLMKEFDDERSEFYNDEEFKAAEELVVKRTIGYGKKAGFGMV